MSSVTGRSIPPADPLKGPQETLPTMYDLPSEFPEEPGLPDEFHDLQPQLLSRTLSLANYRRDNWFTGTDLNVYYDADHPLWHKRPDWFLSVNVPRLYGGEDMRLSYVVWQERKSPSVVIEFLSPRNEREDLGRFYSEQDRVDDSRAMPVLAAPIGPPSKLDVYESYLQVPHYIVYSRYSKRLRYFKRGNAGYEEQSLLDDNPRIWLGELAVGLGLWFGTFEGLPGSWLRWCDRAGNWLLTDTEHAEQQAKTERMARERAQQQAEAAQQRAEAAQQQAEVAQMAKEQAQQQVERLAARLRALGIDPEKA